MNTGILFAFDGGVARDDLKPKPLYCNTVEI